MNETTKADGNFCPLPTPKSESKCVEDCKKIIDLAKKTIADRDRLIADQQQTVKDLGVSLDTVTKDRDSKQSSLNSWYHSPLILPLLGMIIGGIAVDRLEHR